MAHLDENGVLALLDGAAPALAQQHLDTCTDCRRLVAAVARTTHDSSRPTVPGAPLARGASVGRYVVLQTLGAGGMGVVYAAYDPELDRRVALKLLHGAGEAPGRPDAEETRSALRARLLREAQAMARLQHPEVISVYDTGTVDGQVFIAMELVDGQTLGAWLRERPRTPAEIVDRFRAAGRGLQAAHAAGLVHRDFKPDNVLVGKDGRVRVTDFGLVRPAPRGAEPAAPAPPVDPPADAGRPLLDQTLTDSGAILGTPAYMSPEHFTQQTADARSDQFSFCVALYEALYGERPFAGRTLTELRAAVSSGELRAPRRGVRVPPWLLRTVVRGLAVDPAGRWPSMAALVEALGHDARRRQLRILRWSSALAAIVLAGWLSYRYAARQPCTGTAAQLAGTWDGPRRAAVERTFSASQRPFAKESLAGTLSALDAWSARWVAARTDACEATRLRGEQSEELLDLRMACLDERKKELGALVELLGAADAGLIERSVAAAHALSAVEACGDRGALTAVAPPPAPIAARVIALRGQLAEIRARDEAGRYDDAMLRVRPIVDEARRLGYRPLLAETLYQAGHIAEKKNDVPAAEPLLSEASLAAEATRADRLAARARIGLVDVIAYRGARHDQAGPLIDRAQAALDRLGGDEELAGMLDYYRASIDLESGRAADALTGYQHALARFEKALGPEHSHTAGALDALGGVQLTLGRLDDALATSQRALAVTERSLGAHHPDVAFALDKQGVILNQLGRFPEARVALERSLAIREGSPDDPYLGASLINLADLERVQDRLEPALALHRRALPVLERTLGADHPYLAQSLQGQSWLLNELGRHNEALAAGERAVQIAEKQPDSPITPIALTRVGEAQLALGAAARALPPLERAVLLAAKFPDEAAHVGAEPRFALARALRASHRENGRALALAREARAIYATAGPLGQRDVARIDAWLAGAR